MITFSSTTTINRPPADVRAFFANIQRYHEWMPVSNVRMTSGRSDQAGARINMQMPGPMGRRYDMDFEVAEASAQRYVWRIVRGGPLRGEYRAEMEPVGGLLSPVIQREVRSGEAHELLRAKELLEAEATPAGNAG